MIKLWAGAFTAAALATAAPAANPDDAALNGLYETLASGAAAASAETIAGVFAEDAILLYEGRTPAMTGAAFRDSLKSMSDRLKTDRVTLSSEFRIERRLVSDGLSVDNGVLRRTMKRPDGTSQTQYAKFVVAARRQTDGRWKIVTDASMAASQEAWDRAVPVEGLKYDGAAG